MPFGREGERGEACLRFRQWGLHLKGAVLLA